MMSIGTVLVISLLLGILTDVCQRAGAGRENVTIFAASRRLTDIATCTLGGIVSLVCVISGSMAGNLEEILPAAAFGAFLARAAVSDARTATIADEILAPLLVLAPIWKWIAVTGEAPGLVAALLMAAAGLAAYLVGWWAFMRWERFRMTPPDFVLVLVFVLIPHAPVGHLAGAFFTGMFYLALKANPGLATAMMCEEERRRMREDALLMEEGEPRGQWIPLYMFCVPALFLAMVAGQAFA